MTTTAIQPKTLDEHVRKLTAALRAQRGLASAAELLDGLREGIDQLQQEHAGMADELLAVYEQLGIVFEVTRSLPAAASEADVLELFLKNLRSSFRDDTVLSPTTPADAIDAMNIDNPQEIADVTQFLEERQGHRNVAVSNASAVHDGYCEGQMLAGPVFAGNCFVTYIALVRRAGAPPFHSAEMLLLESLLTFCGDIIRNVRLVRELGETSMAMVRALVNAVDQKDPYTSGHSVRVGYFATMLGRRVGLCENELQMLEWAALLHDVGKIGIRDEVLKKTGKLTDEEFDHIKEHPVRSHMIVQQIPSLREALGGVLHHHEKYNGKGYPTGLAGTEIPLQARIIQIADIFDALTSSRSYRAAFGWQKALDILKEEAGTTIDPELQPVFDAMIREQLEGRENAWEEMEERAGRIGSGMISMGNFNSEAVSCS